MSPLGGFIPYIIGTYLMQTSGTQGNAGMVSKLGIWLLMVTVALLFGAISLLFLGTPDSQVAYRIPWAFYLNTVILLLSSALLHWGWLRRNVQGRSQFLPQTILVGVLFLASQVFAWYQMLSAGLGINNAGPKISYLYVLTGLHAAHLIGGLLFLLYVWRTYDKHGRRYLEGAIYFWHFLGVLWIYLLAVMMVNGI